MTFTHQQPFHQLEQVDQQVNQVFDELEQAGNSIHSLSRGANIKISQTPATVKLTAVLPHLNIAQLKVEVIDKSVLISGEFDENSATLSLTQSPDINPVRWVVALPTDVISKPVNVDYSNGVLTVLLQKIDVI